MSPNIFGSAALPVQPGTQLGPYKILSLIGTGGMGTVYLATDTRLERKVALKVLTKEAEQNQDSLLRFEKEAKAVAAISHPNILAIYDIGSDQNVPYIVTEYLEGDTLRQRLTGLPVDWKKATEIAVLIADALAGAHAKGIIHRDIKPENIFLTAEDHVKVLDFGLARLTAPAKTDDLSAVKTETQTAAGLVMGTIPYMSPEQARGEPIDARSDIYSLGCVLHEMITGRRLFLRASPAETIAAILKEEAAVVSTSVAVPPALDAVIARCLEKRPEDRFQSARELHIALKQILTTSAASTTYITPATQQRKKRIAGIVLAIVLLVAIGTGFYLYLQRDASNTSIAVLPFFNEDANSESDYFSDGITESLINKLSRLPQLKVIARTSAFRYKGKDVDPLQAGKELGVEHVLTGRILLQGDTLIVQADLLDVESGSQLWGERFNRRFSDVFLIQEGISREILQKLSLRLSAQQQQTLEKRQTANLDAYHLYLKGKYYWNKRSPANIHRAVSLFQQAIDKDPAYAEAYVGKAEALIIQSQYANPSELIPLARSAAMKALEVDPGLGEAYATLAFVKAYFEWDWAGAETEFQKAIRLNPNYATAHHWYGLVLTALGRFEDAKMQFARALEIDPMSLIINVASTGPYMYGKDYAQAEAIARKVLDMDPDFVPAMTLLASVLDLAGHRDESMELRVRVFEVFGDIALAREVRRRLQENDVAGAQQYIVHTWETQGRPYIQPWLYATVYADLKQKEKSLQWLKKSFERRDTELIFIRVNPAFDFLRDDPQFQKIIEAMNFPDNK